jgi:transketolase
MTQSPHLPLLVLMFSHFYPQEGVAMEALAFAGHFKLDNLVLIYDSNDVTLDAMAAATQSENAVQRFESIGFNVVWVQHGNDIAQIAAAVDLAKAFVGKPTVIILRTTIGKGIAEVAGTSKAHGEGGAKFIPESKKKLGLPDGSHFFVSEETRSFFAARKQALKAKHAKWTATFEVCSSLAPFTLAPTPFSRRRGRPLIQALLPTLRLVLTLFPMLQLCLPKFPCLPPTLKLRRERRGRTCCSPFQPPSPTA